MRIGVVAEGVTDQVVIESIAKAVLRDVDDDLEVLPLQPPVEGTIQQDFGGWEQVLVWLRNRQYRQFLQFDTDLIVIQIDTDACDQPHFGVPRPTGGNALADLELIALVRARLEREIDEEFLREYGARLVFAIAVNEIECWLLPLYAQGHKASATTSCVEKLNEALDRLNPWKRWNLPRFEKTYPVYQRLATDLKKRKHLDAARKHSPSLDAFVADLEAKCRPVPPPSVEVASE